MHIAGAVYNSGAMIIEISHAMCHGSLCHDMNNNNYVRCLPNEVC